MVGAFIGAAMITYLGIMASAVWQLSHLLP